MKLEVCLAIVCALAVMVYVTMECSNAYDLYVARSNEQMFSAQMQAQFECISNQSRDPVQVNRELLDNGVTYTDLRPLQECKPPILLLPGLVKSQKSFEYFAYVIAVEGRRVVIPPEQMMYQQLQNPYGLDQIAIDVLKFAAAVGLRDYQVVGHSFGALVALRMCLIAQHDVKHVVAVSPYLSLAVNPFGLIANHIASSDYTTPHLLHIRNCSSKPADEAKPQRYIRDNYEFIARAQRDTKNRVKHIYAHVDFVIAQHEHLIDNDDVIQTALRMQHSTIQTIGTSHFVAKSSAAIILVLDLLQRGTERAQQSQAEAH